MSPLTAHRPQTTSAFAPRKRRLSPFGLWRRIGLALSLRRQRLHLSRLDDHLLADVGLSRDAANAEAARPLWDAPSHWLTGSQRNL